MLHTLMRTCAGIGAAALLGGTAVQAADITVTHWGAAFYGAPYAVAMEKGYFKDNGVDVTGIVTSSGGGTSVRNTLASELPYGEVALPAAVEAINAGQDLVIVNGGVATVGDIQWVTKKGGDFKSLDQIKGRKIAYTRPGSVTNMLLFMILDKLGVAHDEVELIAAGGVGANLTAVLQGAVDAGVVSEPVWSLHKEKLQRVFLASEAVSTDMMQTVGVVPREYLDEHADQIRGIILARRKGVQFIRENPDEAAKIVGKHYDMEADLVRRVFDTFLGIGYWSEGELDRAKMDRMVEGLRIVGEIDGPVDWGPMTDEAYLPEDLRGGLGG